MIKCTICNKSDQLEFETKFKEWDLIHCISCDLMFWYPLSFVQEQYNSDTRYIQLAFSNVPVSYHFEALKLIKSNIISDQNHPVRILEIGCGNGSFNILLSSSLSSPVDYYGIDLNCNAIDNAKEFSNGHFYCGNILDDSIPMPINNIDVLCFFEVLEHQTEINKFMDKIVPLINKNGWIIGSLPNRNRYLPFSIRESVDYPPHHYTWWNSNALNLFLSYYHFNNLHIIPCNPWTIWDMSLYVETLLFRKIKETIKSFIFRSFLSNHQYSQERMRSQIKSLFILKLTNSKFARVIRSLIFMPLAVPLYVHCILSGRKERSLVFMAKRGER